MNVYQRIALVIGFIILILIFGKTMARISFGLMGMFGKAIIIIVVTIFIIMGLKRAFTKKE